ncbi:hypothetical protein [Saccharopolyspora pogona]|uniref:hypothetical protein n=1 Tax=Saccharopolyspora pogona TaxID=333966 RepID=UPI001681C3CB|nr:hypothetical protein [Saccharopolyspora pogona]
MSSMEHPPPDGIAGHLDNLVRGNGYLSGVETIRIEHLVVSTIESRGADGRHRIKSVFHHLKPHAPQDN